MSRNSSPEDVDRNSGFYFFVYFGSGVVGNVYWYYQFGDSGDDIDSATRDTFVTVLLAVSIAGIAVYCLLLPMPWANEQNNDESTDNKTQKKPISPIEMLKKSLNLLATREMALLSVFFLYDGLAVTFWSGVYGPTLSFTNNFDMDGHSLAGLHGIMVYAGCMLGGGSLAILGQVGYKLRRYPVVLLATILNFVAYALILLYVPKDAPLGETELDEVAILDPGNTALALTASVLMGVSTGLMETQILALLGAAYPDEASHAFAVQKVVYHGAKCVSFGYVGFIDLYWQLGILVALGTLGTLTFTKVDFDARKLELQLKRQQDDDCQSSTASSEVVVI